jgi:hypothetical protein
MRHESVTFRSLFANNDLGDTVFSFNPDRLEEIVKRCEALHNNNGGGGGAFTFGPITGIYSSEGSCFDYVAVGGLQS